MDAPRATGKKAGFEGTGRAPALHPRSWDRAPARPAARRRQSRGFRQVPLSLPGSRCPAHQRARLDTGAVLPGLRPIAVQWQLNAERLAVFVNQIQDRHDANLLFSVSPRRSKEAAGQVRLFSSNSLGCCPVQTTRQAHKNDPDHNDTSGDVRRCGKADAFDN